MSIEQLEMKVVDGGESSNAVVSYKCAFRIRDPFKELKGFKKKACLAKELRVTLLHFRHKEHVRRKQGAYVCFDDRVSKPKDVLPLIGLGEVEGLSIKLLEDLKRFFFLKLTRPFLLALLALPLH